MSTLSDGEFREMRGRSLRHSQILNKAKEMVFSRYHDIRNEGNREMRLSSRDGPTVPDRDLEHVPLLVSQGCANF